MNIRHPSLLEISALVFVLLFQENLIESWLDGPLERDSWMAMAIWLLPIIGFRLAWIGKDQATTSCHNLIIIGLALTVLGILGSVNTLKNCGLACALAGFIPWTPLSPLWIASAMSWMRPFGYLGSYYLGAYITTSRLCVVIPSVAIILWSLWKEKEVKKHEVA